MGCCESLAHDLDSAGLIGMPQNSILTEQAEQNTTIVIQWNAKLLHKTVYFTPDSLLRGMTILACQRKDAPPGQRKIKAFDIIKPMSNSQ